ncbi:hypothetical protein L211DRAFT_717265 [Terfezia boudieri ATCC MYA-4762]|uniref:F-box domain-containing protein n=1 Tax=Terfezia boudieri ATCC MYA-4762 TaxID=1051890 RepID=A0A3N4LTZ9_9PEZI|nr:hypothetical protein L211DRAFT_717265 [Terfezia boudieri ATCC MYA-4762]
MPTTLQPGFSPSPFLQKSGSGGTKAPGICKPSGLSPQFDPFTRLQSLPSIQSREHDALRRKEEVHLPPELWDMILDEVDCTSIVTGLCRVSRELYHAATPKLYSRIGILYKSSDDVSLVNPSEASIKDTDSLEKNSTPFTATHWHHLRHVRSLIIVDAAQGFNQGCNDATCQQCGTSLNSNLQQIDIVFGRLEQILRKMAFPKSIKWLRRNAVPLPEVVLETIGKKFGDSLNRLHLDIWSYVKVEEKIEAAIGRMTCLKELELTGISQNEALAAIGNYLQSPAGESVRELRLEGISVRDPSRRIQGLQKLLGFDRGSSKTNTKLEIESLHLRHIHPDEADTGRSLSMMINPKTLTSITLIDCGSLVKQFKGTSTFPNLKRLYLGGAYQHIPMVFDELPVLEELIISVDARIEQQFYGGITRYFKQKGHGLQRLGVIFTQRAENLAADGESSSSYKRSERVFMERIREHCKNLEELGIWHTDIFFAESIIIRLPKLRGVSLNNNSAELGPPITYPPPYPTGLSGIQYLFLQSDIETSSTLAKPRSQLTFIKQNNEAWRRLGPGVGSRSGDHIMPAMTIRKLSRNDTDIPRIFLVEDSYHQDCRLWGSGQAPERLMLRP